MAQLAQKKIKKPSYKLEAFFFMAIVFLVVLVTVILWGCVLYPFIGGLFIAYTLSPLMEWCAQKLNSRSLAAALIVVSLILILLLGVIEVFPFLKQQTLYLLQKIPYYSQAAYRSFLKGVQHLKTLLPDMVTSDTSTQFSEHFFNMAQWNRIAMKKVISGGSMMVNNTFTLLVILPLVVFFLMLDGKEGVKNLKDLIPKRFVPIVLEQLSLMDRAFSGFIRGQVIIALILGAFYSVGLSLLGLDFAFIIGIGAGILSFLPYVGTFVGLSVSLLIGFYQFDSLQMFLCIPTIFILAQAADMFLLSPHFIGKRVNLHSLWMLFALFVGGSLYGFFGALLAIPVAAVIGVLTRFGIGAYREHASYLRE